MNINESKFPITVRDRIILAGAGFSASVGGFLAIEMWEKLLLSGEVYKYPELKQIIKDPKHKFDYERIFHHILNSPDLDQHAKTAAQNAIDEAYREHNRHVQDQSVIGKINYKWLRSFLKCFRSTEDEAGLLFTTNQDLFFENLTRALDRHNGLDTYIPCNMRSPDRQSTGCFLSAVGLPDYGYSNNKPTLPKADDLPQALQKSWEKKEALHMVKLHGSWGWKEADAQQQMIVGMNKKDLIEKVPLLKYYLKLFENTMSNFKGKLLVIGYSFSDPHINQAIVSGVENGMELHVIDRLRPKDFYEALKDSWPAIWSGLSGYYPYDLQNLFPVGESEFSAKDKIMSLHRHFEFSCNNF